MKKGPIECALGYGRQVTIQNPTVADLEAMSAAMLNPSIIGMEVSIDFRPKEALTLEGRTSAMEELRLWLLAHLYPWQGPGIQFAHRVSRRRGHAEPVWCDTKLRRPERNETLYFGHAKDRYANPDEPNFAFMRLYEKTTDQGSRLPPKKTSVRVEVSLNEAGCRHFGLRTPTDVFEFNFRNLSDYFRLVRPVFVTPRLRSRLRKSIHTAAHKKLAELVTAKQLAIVEDQARTAGVWSLHNARHVFPTLGRHVVGNRVIGTRLDNLTKKYKSGPTTDPIFTRLASASDPRCGSW